MNKIINFHDVKDINWFEDIILILTKKYDLVAIDSIESFFYEKKSLRNACHITVDDGNTSFYDIIYPVLKKHNIPATLFISPEACLNQQNFWFQEIEGYDMIELHRSISSFLGIEENLLKGYPASHILKNLKIDEIWKIIEIYKQHLNVIPKKCVNMGTDKIVEIDNDGLVAIGAHTMSHPILFNEDDLNCRKQISSSIFSLSRLLGHEIKYFAYPNGVPNLDFGDREIDILVKAGCKLAFSTESKNFTEKNDPFSIPRFGISHGNRFFVNTKLFLGEYWNTLRELRIKGEKKSRTELKAIINTKIRKNM